MVELIGLHLLRNARITELHIAIADLGGVITLQRDDRPSGLIRCRREFRADRKNTDRDEHERRRSHKKLVVHVLHRETPQSRSSGYMGTGSKPVNNPSPERPSKARNQANPYHKSTAVGRTERIQDLQHVMPRRQAIFRFCTRGFANAIAGLVDFRKRLLLLSKTEVFEGSGKGGCHIADIFIWAIPLEIAAVVGTCPCRTKKRDGRGARARKGKTAMQSTLLLAFGALVLFQLKHFACDFAFQTQRQIDAKPHYGKLGGLEHAGLHAITSVPALCVLTTSPPIILGVALAEFAVHYHVDFFKARIDNRLALKNTTRAYWAVFGFDQFVHQATYLAIVLGVMALA